MVTSTENAKSFIEINQILIAMQVYTFTSKATWYVLSKINQNVVPGGGEAYERRNNKLSPFLKLDFLAFSLVACLQ